MKNELRILDKLDQIEAKFDHIDARLEHMDTKFDHIDARFDLMEKKTDTIEIVVRAVVANIEKLDKKMDDGLTEVKSDIASLDSRLTGSIDSLASGTKKNFDSIETSIFQLQMHMDARD